MTDVGDEATRLFDARPEEVTLLRRAVERLAADRAGDAQALVYSETLGVVAADTTAPAQRVDALAKRPALSLTLEEMNRRIGSAGSTGRFHNRRVIAAAPQTIEEVATKLGRHLASVSWRLSRSAGCAGGIGSSTGGAVLWTILTRSMSHWLPVSWLLPKRMAARTLKMPNWEGEQRLTMAGDPQAFADVLAGNRLAAAPHGTLNACRKQAAKIRKTVRCAIRSRRKGRTDPGACLSCRRVIQLADGQSALIGSARFEDGRGSRDLFEIRAGPIRLGAGRVCPSHSTEGVRA